MPRLLGWCYGWWRFLMSEVPPQVVKARNEAVSKLNLDALNTKHNQVLRWFLQKGELLSYGVRVNCDPSALDSVPVKLSLLA